MVSDAVSREKKYCLNCRFLELRKAEDGSAIYWCLSKKISPGACVLGRRACDNYRPWWEAGLATNAGAAVTPAAPPAR